MRFHGWANRRNASGASFGIYMQGATTPFKLPKGAGLEEVLRQTMDLVLSDKESGIICKREYEIRISGDGQRSIEIITEWLGLELVKKDNDSCKLIVKLPFLGDDEAPMEATQVIPEDNEVVDGVF